MKLPLLTLTLITASVAFAAEKVPLTFSAVLTTSKEKRFGVATEGGTHSAWVNLGGEFEGYKLSDYDDNSQTLTLQHNGKAYKLPMASGNVRPMASKATLDDAAVVLSKMKFEQMMARTIIDQQKQTVSLLSRQMLGQMNTQIPSDELAAFQVKLMDVLWAEMKPEDLKNDVAKIYADLFSKEELRSMSEFYATPAGGALVDKQPQMQQKMMDLVTPRMLKAMPRIQEMSTEFAAQQKAKNPSGMAGAAKPGTSSTAPASIAAPAKKS